MGTYWNQESDGHRPYFMYWQPWKGRHAITPQMDFGRQEDPDLFPEIACGQIDPGAAFYRPMPHNEWVEFDFRQRCWFKHPPHANIKYTPLAQHEVPGLDGPVGYAPKPGYVAPPTPRGVPAAATP